MDFMVLPYNPITGTPGDHVMKPDGNLQSVTGKDEVRQMAWQALLNRKGYYRYNENLGSDLWRLPRDYPATDDTASLGETMAIEALERQMPGIIKDVAAQGMILADGLYLDVSYKIIATDESDSIKITTEDLINA